MLPSAYNVGVDRVWTKIKDLDKCMTLFAATVARRAKFRSNRRKAAQFTVVTASRSTANPAQAADSAVTVAADTAAMAATPTRVCFLKTFARLFIFRAGKTLSYPSNFDLKRVFTI